MHTSVSSRWAITPLSNHAVRVQSDTLSWSEAAQLGAELLARAGIAAGGRSRTRPSPLPPPELDVSAPRFDLVAGQEHARRAAEVALTGGHPIAFIGRWEAQALGAAVNHHQRGLALAVLPCPCGHHGDPDLACSCKPTRLAHYRHQHRATIQTMIMVEVGRCPAEKLLSFVLRGRFGEPDEDVLDRVRRAREMPLPSTTLSESSLSLLQAAMRQLHLDQHAIDRLLCVSQSIARLAGQTAIQPAHLAEAVQYRARW